MRRTHSLILVLQAMMEDPLGRHWGYDLSKRSGVRSGVLYPIVHRMLADGMLEDGWERQDESLGRKRPPRRYYKLTPSGLATAKGILRDAAADPRFEALVTDDPLPPRPPIPERSRPAVVWAIGSAR